MKTYLSLYPKFLIIMIGFMILICGCSRQTVTNATETVGTALEMTVTPLPPSETAVPTSTNTQMPSVTSIATLTSTSIPTSTTEPTYTPTWTPISRLSPEESLSTILEMYADNGGCKLPCWWGIVPGETPWEEVHRRLAPLGDSVATDLNENRVRYDFQFAVPDELSPHGYFWLYIVIDENTVTSMGINASYVQSDFDYTLAGLLAIFGPPEEIWLKLFPESMGDPHYNISLFYPDKGIEISADGSAQLDKDVFTICPQEFELGNFPPGLILWDPRDNVNFKNVGSELLENTNMDENRQDYHLLQDITEDFSETDFYETYLDPNTTACFDIDLTKLP